MGFWDPIKNLLSGGKVNGYSAEDAVKGNLIQQGGKVVAPQAPKINAQQLQQALGTPQGNQRFVRGLNNSIANRDMNSEYVKAYKQSRMADLNARYKAGQIKQESYRAGLDALLNNTFSPDLPNPVQTNSPLQKVVAGGKMVAEPFVNVGKVGVESNRKAIAQLTRNPNATAAADTRMNNALDNSFVLGSANKLVNYALGSTFGSNQEALNQKLAESIAQNDIMAQKALRNNPQTAMKNINASSGQSLSNLDYNARAQGRQVSPIGGVLAGANFGLDVGTLGIGAVGKQAIKAGVKPVIARTLENGMQGALGNVIASYLNDPNFTPASKEGLKTAGIGFGTGAVAGEALPLATKAFASMPNFAAELKASTPNAIAHTRLLKDDPNYASLATEHALARTSIENAQKASVEPPKSLLERIASIEQAMAQRRVEVAQGGYARVPSKNDAPQVGKTVDAPTAKDLEMGKALGMTPEDVAKAQQNDVMDSFPGAKQASSPEAPSTQATAKQPKYSETEADLLGLGSRAETSSGQADVSVGSTKQPKVGQKGTSSNELLPQLELEVKGHPTYDVKKKVSILDKLRTPDRVLRKIGLGDVADKIKTANRDYQIELPQQIDKVSQWYDQVNRSPEASQRIFKYLDGQKDAQLSGVELKVAKEIQTYLKEWADRLGLPEDKRITNYITHIFDEKLVNKEFDPDLEKLIADKVPGSVYDPFTLQRLGAKGYKEDAFAALDAYVKRGTRKVHMDGVLSELADRAGDLDKTGFDYVKNYADRVNMRPTDLDNSIDVMIKQTPIGYGLGQRPTAKVTRAIRQATYRATLGLNVGSAVRNLTQGINTFAELGTKWTTKGYYDNLKNWNSGELEKVGVLDNSFIEDRSISATKKFAQNADKVLFSMFEGAEKVNRGSAYFGAKAKALSEGKSLQEAVKAGVDAAEKTQFTFGRVNTPLAMQSDISKLFTQFQSYNIKQTEFIVDMVQNKEYAKLLRYIGATGVVFGGMSAALGYKPEDMLPFGSNVANGTSPIGGAPVFKLASGAKKVYSELTKEESPNAKTTKGEKVKKAAVSLGLSAGATFVPAFTQAKKTVTGVQAVAKGEATINGETVPVAQTPTNLVKGALFGPYSLKNNSPIKVKDSTQPSSNIKPADDKAKKAYDDKIKKGAYELSFTQEERDFLDKPKEEQTAIARSDQKYADLLKRKQAYDNIGNKASDIPVGMDNQLVKVLDKDASLTQRGKARAESDPQYNLDLAMAKIERDRLNGKLSDDEVYNKSEDLIKLQVGVEQKLAGDKLKQYLGTPAGKYKVETAKYKLAKDSGRLSITDDMNARSKIDKLNVQKDFSKDAVDLYSLSKTELRDALEAGMIPNGTLEELKKLDSAMITAKLAKTSKFSIGGSGSSKKLKARKLKIARARLGKLKSVKMSKAPSVTGMRVSKPKTPKIGRGKARKIKVA